MNGVSLTQEGQHRASTGSRWQPQPCASGEEHTAVSPYERTCAGARNRAMAHRKRERERARERERERENREERENKGKQPGSDGPHTKIKGAALSGQSNIGKPLPSYPRTAAAARAIRHPDPSVDDMI